MPCSSLDLPSVKHGGTEAHLYEMNLADVARIIGEIFLFAAATWFLSATILRKLIVLLQGILDVPHLSFGLLLGGLFLVVVGAEGAGLHGSLGALLFGAALSTLPYQVRRDLMQGLRGSAERSFRPIVLRVCRFEPDLRFPLAACDDDTGARIFASCRQIRGGLCRSIHVSIRCSFGSISRSHGEGRG